MSTQTVYFDNPASITNLQSTTTTHTTQITSMSGSISSLNTSTSTLDFDVSPVQFSDGKPQNIPLPFYDATNYEYFVIMRHGPRKPAATSNARPYDSETSTGALTPFGRLLKPEYLQARGDLLWPSDYSKVPQLNSTTGASIITSTGAPNIPYVYATFNDPAPLTSNGVERLQQYLTAMMTGGKFPLTFDWIGANAMARTLQTAQVVVNTQKTFDKTGTYNPVITTNVNGVVNTNAGTGSGTWVRLVNSTYSQNTGELWTMGWMFTGAGGNAEGIQLYGPNGIGGSGIGNPSSNNILIAGDNTNLHRYDTIQSVGKLLSKYYTGLQTRDFFGSTNKTSLSNYFCEARPGNPDLFSPGDWASVYTGSFGGLYNICDYLVQQYFVTGSPISQSMTPQELCSFMNFNATFLNAVSDYKLSHYAAAKAIPALYDWACGTGTRFPGWNQAANPKNVLYCCNEQFIQSMQVCLGTQARLGNQGYCFPQGAALIFIKMKNRQQQSAINSNYVFKSPIIGFLVAPGITDPTKYDSSPIVNRGSHFYIQNCDNGKGAITNAYNRVTAGSGVVNAGYPYFGFDPVNDWDEIISSNVY